MRLPRATYTLSHVNLKLKPILAVASTSSTFSTFTNTQPEPNKTMTVINTKLSIPQKTLLEAFRLMATAKSMSELYEENFKLVSKYVHATSRGHEAIQLALGMQLLPQDYLFPYYRDDAMLLSIGMRPYELMLQLLAKRDDPFSGGRTYYAHPSLKDPEKPKIPHQSSATGMQAIPATGVALGFWYREARALTKDYPLEKPIVVCSLGDASMTEGEVSEAMQMAVLKKLPILYLVQDNGWDISASAAEVRAQSAAEYATGFKGLETRSIHGNDFFTCYETLREVIALVRQLEARRGQRARLIVGDTLARLSAGANENAGQDMGLVVRRFDCIRTECKVHFLLVHHSGKAAAAGARGWSGIRAAVDTEIEVTDSPTGRCAEVTKQRDLSTKGERIGFRLDPVHLGFTKWGAPATSCVVVAADAPVKTAGKRISEVGGAILEMLRTKGSGIKKREVVKHFDGRYDSSAVYRELKRLVEAGQVHECIGIVAIAGGAKGAD